LNQGHTFNPLDETGAAAIGPTENGSLWGVRGVHSINCEGPPRKIGHTIGKRFRAEILCTLYGHDDLNTRFSRAVRSAGSIPP
jgi:hypothetical protein